jgi:hypothetical protein
VGRGDKGGRWLVACVGGGVDGVGGGVEAGSVKGGGGSVGVVRDGGE